MAIFCSGNGSTAHFFEQSSTISLTGFPLAVGFIAATSGAFAAYDGWGNLASVAGEIINPGKNIAKSFIVGMLICMGVYLLVNLAYLYVMNVDAMAGTKLVAASALQISVGGIAAALISAMIMVSCFGATNVNVMACPRVTFAVWPGRDFSSTGPERFIHVFKLRERVVASCNLEFTTRSSGSFDMLTDMFVFVSWIFYAIIARLFILRKKEGHRGRIRFEGYQSCLHCLYYSRFLSLPYGI